MKKFTAPEINIQELDSESVMATSSCFEAFACTECYCTVVQCSINKFGCSGLVCDTLSDYL